MMAADTAMYAAKAGGRSRAGFHTREMAERSAQRPGVEQGLRRAIAGDEIEVAYQPLVDLRDGSVAGLEALVRWRVPHSGLPASRLALEITESTLHAVERSRRFIAAMDRLGVAVAIDDFGTHDSSLSLLKHLSIDRLKIDPSFVHDLPPDADSVAIVQAILALSKALTLDVTAEGIEREDPRAMLSALGRDVGQGWLFAPPLAADAVPASPNARRGAD